MKFKFPQGITQYHSATGDTHQADEDGHLVTEHEDPNLAADLLRAGFTAVVEAVEAVIEAVVETVEGDLEKPEKVLTPEEQAAADEAAAQQAEEARRAALTDEQRAAEDAAKAEAATKPDAAA